jgi:hypothetical protein
VIFIVEVKMNMDLDEDTIIKVDELKHKLKLNNNVEVVYYGLALLIKIMDALESGTKVRVKSKKLKYPSRIVTTFTI